MADASPNEPLKNDPAASQSQINRPPVPKASGDQQVPEHEQQGTKNNPFIIEIINPAQTNTDTATQQKEQ